jgi:hypothetical protein
MITKVNGQAATSNIQLQELTLTKKAGDRCRSATAAMAGEHGDGDARHAP